MRKLGLLALCGSLLALSGARAQDTQPSAARPILPRHVRKVYGDGKHNAFTALARWKDAYWLAFRSGPSAAYGEADLVVLRSRDAREWTEAFRINALPDDRDPQFLVTPRQLFLYHSALKGGELTSYVTATPDGKTWSAPQPVYQPQFTFWKPVAHKGRFYATASKKVEGEDAGKAREVHLITSADGLKWEKLSTIRAGNWESEATLWFAPDEKIHAFLRTEYYVPGSILEAAPPYTEWQERPARVHLSGHAVETIQGVTYVLSRTTNLNGADPGAMVYTYEAGELKPYCYLPAGGDCSYASAVRVGDEMLVSYYSSHEGPTNIYLARVPLKQPAKGRK